MKCKLFPVSESVLEDIKQPGFENVKIRWLVTEADGAPNFVMRLFEIKEGACSAKHIHNWEHEVFILEGQCTVFCDGKEKRLGPHSAVFIAPNVVHNFRNSGKGTLKFLCIIPNPKEE